jgi:hypothetical protein
MTSSQIRNRLARLVGETEALDLLEAPNGHLGGRSPQDLLDSGDFAPVMRLIENMELEEIARSKWIHNADPLVDRVPHRAPQRKVKRVLDLLDQLDNSNGRFLTR